MLFKYKVVDEGGTMKEGDIDAPGRDAAIGGLQRRGFIVISIKEAGKGRSVLPFSFSERIPMKEVVVLSRQIATLFEAQVSALKAFTMLAGNTENKALARKLVEISDDLQAGVSISGALAKHPAVFSDFYVNMVRVGEETGKLNDTFAHLAGYLARQYALTSKTRNAMIYPAFVIFTFLSVMGLMFTVVIPKLSAIILDSGVEPPIYTKAVIGLSEFFVSYGFLVVIFIILLGIWLWRLSLKEQGRMYLDRLRLSLPAVGGLYRKLYLSRLADNMDTMLTAGIPIVRAIDVSADIIGSLVYRNVLKEVADGVKSGLAFSAAFERHREAVPSIMTQMIKVGEETGSLGSMLRTLAEFYKREVDDAVDTMVGLIEPVMIVLLGLGVGILLVSVLVPIYNMTGGIG